MKKDFLPLHLQKYVVEQHYEKYTSIDQAVWRYILRQLKAFLSTHAHDCYLEGLNKTGINVETIPRIEDISKELQKFGWKALPVSGFIPPAAFMELQSLGVLPIASDMRTLDHLLYTPAPDIVHEAAGHAPILIHPEFSNYLKNYAQVAKKAIISKEDLDVYEAIRELSDLKENPQSTPEQIKAAELHLEKIGKNISHVSEASELSRMNWWTAEYGLIGELDNPKIFGAGLLSSVGESKWCLNPKVKKIPLTVDCIKTTYDITEPQPQLYVTPDFKTLNHVLDEMANQMAFRTGGLQGLKKAQQAQSVNTVELDSGLQISGQLVEILTDNSENPIFIRFAGPSQLSVQDRQLAGHGKDYHNHGYSSPVGSLKTPLHGNIGETLHLEYDSGITVRGTVLSHLVHEGKTLLVSMKDATVTYQERILFAPEWGTFDLALGTKVTSVFGGPADRVSYGEFTDFVAKRVPQIHYSESELLRQAHYAEVRKIRENNLQGTDLINSLEKVYNKHQSQFPQDWLLNLEILELLHLRAPSHPFKLRVEQMLRKLGAENEKIKGLIQDGEDLLGVP